MTGGVYVDTSALGRILLAEPGARRVRESLARYDVWWSSRLVVVELRRLAARVGMQGAAEGLLAGLCLFAVDDGALTRASRLTPLEVRSLGAIHLDAAVVLARSGKARAVMTYDRQLQSGCAHHALTVDAPA